MVKCSVCGARVEEDAAYLMAFGLKQWLCYDHANYLFRLVGELSEDYE